MVSFSVRGRCGLVRFGDIYRFEKIDWLMLGFLGWEVKFGKFIPVDILLICARISFLPLPSPAGHFSFFHSLGRLVATGEAILGKQSSRSGITWPKLYDELRATAAVDTRHEPEIASLLTDSHSSPQSISS